MLNNIDFDQNKYKIKPVSVSDRSGSSGMIKYLINKGLIKSEKQASVILIIPTILFIAVSIFISYGSFFKEASVPPMTDEQRILFNQNIQ